MASVTTLILLVALILNFVPSEVESATKADFYPIIGTDGYFKVVPEAQDEVSSPEVQLRVPISFYGKIYSSIFVNSNGLLSFTTEIPRFSNVQFPLPFPVIAPLYTDVDTSGSGRVYYRESSEPDILKKAASDVQAHFNGFETFSPPSVFIATWDSVGYYDKGQDKVNTFQVAIVSNGSNSVAVFTYPENGIQWIQSKGKDHNQPDARAQAGFSSETADLHELQGSGTEQIKNLQTDSNIGKSGVWMFHIGSLGSSKIASPNKDNSKSVSNVSNESTNPVVTCSMAGASLCHSKASCIDYEAGLCCKCNDAFYGNGIGCLKKGIPQRVNGKVRGRLNGIRLTDVDLHSYVVTKDGRTYTAMSHIPNTVGYDMLSLSAIGGSISWLFAVSGSESKNGYQITGGKFNTSAEIEFPQTGHHVAVRQYFTGLDAFGYLHVTTEIQGTAPAITETTEIVVSDYDKIFTKVAPGILQSHLRHSYRLKDSTLQTPFTIEQTIQYNECSAAPHTNKIDPTARMRVARNFLIYNAREQIVRYAMNTQITPHRSKINLCDSNKSQCGPNGNCVVDGNSFRCVCNPGYASDRTGKSCTDIDECSVGRHDCHSVYGECINQEGSFTCRCLAGYEGDGVKCKRSLTCDDMNCDINAICQINQDRQPTCVCNNGYQGDGYVCKKMRLQRTCDDLNCDSNAACQIGRDRQPVCVCNRGYQGDGYVCNEETRVHPCHALKCDGNATCQISEDRRAQCVCNRGYQGNGYVCKKETRVHPCDVLKCDGNATCQISEDRRAQCVCNRGYQGDGYVCKKETRMHPCDVLKCDGNATCQISEDRQAQCVCNRGYQGDGYVCKKETRVYPCDKLKCDGNATCQISEDRRAQCVCNRGYQGDGYICSKETRMHPCDVLKCDGNATCQISEDSRAQCVCNRGYQGDGYVCKKETRVHPCDKLKCDVNAACQIREDRQAQCVCNRGYEGDGYICSKETPVELDCNQQNKCHSYAQCLKNASDGSYACKCNPGYIGNGFECTVTDVSCNDVNICSPHAECVYLFFSFGYFCQCKEGFAGDGYTCQPLDECNSVDDCDYNAQCLYDSESARYKCKCNQGYSGDGKECEIEPEAGCNVLNNCHRDANCISNSDNSISRCQCNSGFEGDGINCQSKVQSCNVVNNCDLNADCVKESAQGYRCQCRRGYRGNGFSCQSTRTCDEEPQLCHQHAACILRRDINQYVCQCRQGYTGDGSTCTAALRNKGGFLLFNQGMSVLKMPFNPTTKNKGNLVVLEPSQTALGIDVDCKEGYVYWTDISQAKIKRSTYNGSNIEVVIGRSSGVKSPEGIAVDWISRNIYWTDSLKDTVEVMSLTGKHHKTLINTDLMNPRGIAVNPGREKLYWSDWQRDNPKIEYSNLDGTDRRVLLSQGLSLPNSLTIDYDREELCWSDAGIQKIECMGMYDGKRRTIASSLSYPFGVTTYRDIFYWTDWKQKYIHQLKRGETEVKKLELPLGGNGKLYSIVAVPNQCPRGSNTCGFQNGGCQFICLPNGHGSRSCACPDVSKDNKTSELAICNEIN